MKLRILTVAILSAVLTGCGSSSSSTPAEDPAEQPVNDGSDNPDTENPGTDDPDPNNPDTNNPGTDDPDTENPGTDDPGTDEPGTDNPPTTDTGNSGLSSIQGNVQLLGFMDVDDESQGQSTEVTAGFIRFDSVINAASLQDSLEDELIDQCDVSVTDLLGNGGSLDDLDFEFPFATVSAGETIALSSAAGTYGELQRTTQFGFTGYTSEVELVFPAPSPLTINIPGDVFPAFSNVSVTAPEAITGFNVGATDSINAETAFSWNATNNADSTISLSFSQFDINSFQFISADCVLADDGAFAFSAATVGELNDSLGAGWNVTGVAVSREVVVVQQQGSAVLVVTRTSN